MVSFIVNLLRLIEYTYLGLKKDSEFKSLLIFIVFLLMGSTFFYSKVENWTIIDSLYFSVMTMSTIGYGDFVPTTTFSKIFTIIYTILSIGSFVLFTAKIVKIVLSRKTHLQ